MKKLTLILLALCLVIFTVSAVACGKENNVEDHEETLNIPTSAPEITEEPEGDETTDAYINAAPSNDEQGWGALTPRPGK